MLTMERQIMRLAAGEVITFHEPPVAMKAIYLSLKQIAIKGLIEIIEISQTERNGKKIFTSITAKKL